MIRLIVKTTYQNGPDTTGTGYQTFDVDLPEVERLLTTEHVISAEVIGAEVRKAPEGER